MIRDENYLLSFNTLTCLLFSAGEKGNAFCLLSYYPFNLWLGLHF